MLIAICWNVSQTFQQFDVDGIGIVDAQVMLDAVKKHTDAASVHSDLAAVVRTLRSCAHTPGLLILIQYQWLFVVQSSCLRALAWSVAVFTNCLHIQHTAVLGSLAASEQTNIHWRLEVWFDCPQPRCCWSGSWTLPVLQWPIHNWV